MKEENEPMLIEHEVLRFNQIEGNFAAQRDVIAIEEITNLYINGNLYAVFHHLPSQIKELVIGHLLTGGVIERLEDILEMKISEKNIYVKLSKENIPSIPGKPRLPRLITTFCNSDFPQQISNAAQKLRFNRVRFSAETIFKSVETLNSKASIFRASGGTHAATLIDENSEIVSFAEDIGRHNAIDKVIGEAAIKGFNFSKLLLASTGRLSSEIIIKAVQMGIPILVSMSAPTSMGIKMAEAFGLTLIGFVRGKRFNIYASPDRIEEWAQQSTKKTSAKIM